MSIFFNLFRLYSKIFNTFNSPKANSVIVGRIQLKLCELVIELRMCRILILHNYNRENYFSAVVLEKTV